MTEENNTTSQETEPTKYVLLPDFKTNIHIITLIGVVFVYILLLLSYILTAIYYDTYTPFTGDIFEATKDAQHRLKNHINKVIFSENFTVSNENPKENTTIFDKLRNYINWFITNLFYVKGNTVVLTT